MLAPSANRGELFGESHESVKSILLKIACEADFGTLCLLSCVWMTTSKALTDRGGRGGVARGICGATLGPCLLSLPRWLPVDVGFKGVTH